MNIPTPDAAKGAKPEKAGRRTFLETLGRISVLGALGGTLMSSMRFLLPNVLYEPPTVFPIGRVEDFPPDSVTFLEEYRLFIFRRPEGLYAVTSVCSHLGCNVRWEGEDERFDCPCHGSMFDKNGKVTRGPAPKPLKWYELTRLNDGRLQVNTRRLVTTEFRFKA